MQSGQATWTPPRPGTASEIRGRAGVVISTRRARGQPARGPGRDEPAPRGDHHQLPAWTGKNPRYGRCTDADGFPWLRRRSEAG